MSAIKTYCLIVRPDEDDEEKSMDESLVHLAEHRLNSENYSEYRPSYCPTCACPDPWSQDFLINHLKQHLVTCTHKIDGKFTHGYINQALKYFDECKTCYGNSPVGPYNIWPSHLTPRLRTELKRLDYKDRSYVLKQAVFGIFDGINLELYRKYVSHELWFLYGD
jgi:hypothetical protein